MAKFAVVLLAAFALTGAFAAPKKGAQKNQLDELTQQIQTVANDLSATLQKNIPDSKDVTKAITEQSQQFAHNVEGIVHKLQKEIENNKGKTDDVLKQASEKITETVTSLQQLTGPEATAKANELKAQLESNFKLVSEEFAKLGKAVEPSLQQAGNTLGEFTQGLLNDFVKAAETYGDQLKNTVNKN